MHALLDQRRAAALKAASLELDLKDPRLDQSHDAREARIAEIGRLHAQLRAIKRDLARVGID